MKIAAFWWAGRRHVGRLSVDERDVTPLALGDRAHAGGALALVEAMAEGAPLPKPSGAALPLSAVKLDAPIPVPRRNIFCVGFNYRAHAAEFAAGGVGGPRPPQQAVPEVPVIFSKVPESVIAQEAPIRIPNGLRRYRYARQPRPVGPAPIDPHMANVLFTNTKDGRFHKEPELASQGARRLSVA